MLTEPEREKLEKRLIEDVLQDAEFFYSLPAAALNTHYVSYFAEPVIERIVQGKTDMFRVPGSEIKKEKKTLVVSSSLIRKDIGETFHESEKFLKACLMAGFPLRFWTGEKAVEITKVEDVERWLTDIKSEDEKIMKEKMVNSTTSVDSIFFIDHFKLKEFLVIKKEKVGILSVLDFKAFQEVPEEVFRWLKNKKFYLSFEGVSGKDDKKLIKMGISLIKKLSKNLVGLNLGNINNISVFKAVVKAENIEELRWPGSKYLEINWESLGEKEKIAFTKLKRLEIGNIGMSEALVSKFLNNVPQLEMLSLCLAKDQREIKIDILPCLEEIVLTGTIDEREILNLMSRFPSLKSVILFSVNVTSIHDTLYEEYKQIPFPSLNNLYFCQVTGNGNLIKYIVNNSMNVASLSILACEGLGNFNENEIGGSCSFSQITKLAITGDIPAKTVGKIVSKSNRLTSLDLRFFDNASDLAARFIDKDTMFCQLKEINLFFNGRHEVPIETILTLASRSHSLEEITFSNKRNFNDTSDLDSLSNRDVLNLSHIKFFHLENSNITSQLLGKMLRIINGFETIDISDCMNIGELKPDDICDETVFINLTRIVARNSAIRGDTLAKIMSQSPQLQEVDLRGCLSLDSFNLSIYKDQNLSKNIKNFDSNRKNIPPKEYLFLINLSQELTVFQLSAINLKSVNDEIAFESLPSIKTIKVPNDPSLGPLFGKILKITPNLENILSESLSSDSFPTPYVYRINEENIPDDISFPHLKHFDVSQLSNFTGKASLKIIKAAKGLEVLDFSLCQSCHDLEEKLVTDEISLKNFRVFKCHSSKLPFATIIKFAMMATECNDETFFITREKIKITGRPFSDDNEQLLIPKGTVFKTIKAVEVIGDSLLPAEFSDRLISAMPQVESIRLINVPKLSFSSVLSNLKESYEADSYAPKKTLEIADSSSNSALIPCLFAWLPTLKKINLENLTISREKTYSPVDFMSSSEVSYDNLLNLCIINTTLTAELISFIISKSNNLQLLKIVSRKSEKQERGIFDELIKQEISLKKLKFLHLENLELPEDFVFQLHFLFPSLNSLNVINCTGLSGEKLPTGLSSLFFLCIRNTAIPGEVIKSLIFSAKDLTFLTLVSTGKGSVLDITDRDLTNKPTGLKRFVIEDSFSVIDASAVEWLFTENPQLDRLSLDNCHHIAEIPDKRVDNTVKLKELKQLSLEASTVSCSLFQQVVTNATSLDIVKLQYTTFIETQNVFFHSLSLRKCNISKITFNNAISPLSLMLWLYEKSSMKAIAVNSYDCRKLINQDWNFSEKLLDITDIAVGDSAFRITAFLKMLTLTPNVKKIKLFDTNVFEEADDAEIIRLVKLLKLGKLTEIHWSLCFDDPPFSKKFFILILSTAKNLEKIKIVGADAIVNLTAEDIPDTLFLPKVREFRLVWGATALPDAVLSKLAKACPNCENFDFSSSVTKPRNIENIQKGAVSSDLYPVAPQLGVDLRDGSTHLSAKQFFLRVHPSEYRQEIRPHVNLQGGSVTFDEENRDKIEDNLIEVDVSTVDSDVALMDFFDQISNNGLSKRYEPCGLLLNISKLSRLPSLSPEEKIIKFYTDFPFPYKIKYSEIENCYYLCSEVNIEARQAAVYFVVDLGQDPVYKKAWIFPDDIQTPITYCSNFQPATEKNRLEFKPRATGVEILAEFDKKQIGSCENRSKVLRLKFHHLFKSSGSLSAYRSRLMKNGLHAFLELKDQGGWHKIELGGYFATVDIQPGLFAKSKPRPQTLTSTAPVIHSNHQKPPRTLLTDDLFPNVLAPWKTHPEDVPKTAEALFATLVIPGRKTLIRVEQPDDCLKVVAAFSASQSKRPYLFIDSASDLQWHGKGLKFDQQQSLSIHERFSKVRYFCEAHPDGLWFINWSRFPSNDIGALHCIFDDIRQLENENLPDPLPIVSFYSDNVPDPYQETDFTSRQDAEYVWAYDFPLDVFHHRVVAVEAAPEDGTLSIDLFESNDWEGLLYGTFTIQESQFLLNRQAFLATVMDNTTPLKKLHLINAPWHLREFSLFWQHALQQNEFSLYGKTFVLDPSLQLTHSQESSFRAEVLCSPGSEKEFECFSLNSFTFKKFFDHYEDEHYALVRKQGIFDTHKAVTLVVSESLPKNQWRQLLCEAHRCSVSLRIALVEGVVLPAELSEGAHETYAVPSLPIEKATVKTLFEGSKIAIVVAFNQTTEMTNTLLIAAKNSVAEEALYVDLDMTHHFGDFFYQTQPRIVGKEVHLEPVRSDIWKAMTMGRTVIVKATTLPASLLNALSSLLLSGENTLRINGKEEVNTGNLLIVTDKAVPFARHHFHCTEEIQEIFNVQKISEVPLNPIQPALSPAEQDSDDLSLEACENYETRRFQKIYDGLQQSPIIFYTGPTGIGKSQYFLADFEKDYHVRTGRTATLYIGEHEIAPFAAHSDPHSDPFLVVDEANLSEHPLSGLRGLRSAKRHLLIQGQYSDRLDRHRVILIGNPHEYGGARQQKEFFDQFTLEVEGEAPNHAYYYHRILKPQFKQASSETIAKLMLRIFDETNQIACTAKKTDPILSPRHLRAMTIFYNAYQQRFAQLPVDENSVVIAACLTVMGDVLTKRQSKKLLCFLKNQYHYNPEEIARYQTEYIKTRLDEKRVVNLHEPHFTFTPSRCSVLGVLDTLLSLWQDNNVQLGLLLEGDSATGKSTMVLNYLALCGVNNVVHLSLGKNYQSDCEKLRSALANRQVVIIDELKAGGPTYENLLNTAISSGLKIIATDNGLTFKGRQVLSVALRARFIPLNVPEYPFNEIVDILVNLSVDKEKAMLWAKAFVVATAYAIFHGLPKPNLRNLLTASGAKRLTKPSDEQEVVMDTQQDKKLYQLALRIDEKLDCAALSSSDRTALYGLFSDNPCFVKQDDEPIKVDSKPHNVQKVPDQNKLPKGESSAHNDPTMHCKNLSTYKKLQRYAENLQGRTKEDGAVKKAAAIESFLEKLASDEENYSDCYKKLENTLTGRSNARAENLDEITIPRQKYTWLTFFNAKDHTETKSFSLLRELKQQLDAPRVRLKV